MQTLTMKVECAGYQRILEGIDKFGDNYIYRKDGVVYRIIDAKPCAEDSVTFYLEPLVPSIEVDDDNEKE